MSISTRSDYEYINENEIDDELKCAICKQPLDSPVSLSICHHTFCKQCIKSWLNHNETCPTCRQVTTSRSWRQPSYVPINTRIVLNQLDRLLVRCSFCNETNIQRCHWKNHEKICLKKVIKCSSADIKCTWEGTRDLLAAHLNDCTFQKVRPIIDELKNELQLTQTKQIELNKSVDTLENKILFLLKLINKGNLMTQNCTKPKNECYYNQKIRFQCDICYTRIRREQISLHACTGDCICHSCVNSQYPDHHFLPLEMPNIEDFEEED